MVRDEAMLVRERVNGLLGTEVTLIQQAVGAMLSKKGGKAFQKSLKQISVETRPRVDLAEGEQE